MNINSMKKQLIKKFGDKEYRDLFVAEQIFARLPIKIHLLREQREWTQKLFGEKAGMAQAWVSKLEDPNYGRLTLSTLLKVASTFDVALVVDFVPFSKLLNDTLNLSPEFFEVPSFEEDQFEEKAAVSTTAYLSHEDRVPIEDESKATTHRIATAIAGSISQIVLSGLAKKTLDTFSQDLGRSFVSSIADTNRGIVSLASQWPDSSLLQERQKNPQDTESVSTAFSSVKDKASKNVAIAVDSAAGEQIRFAEAA